MSELLNNLHNVPDMSWEQEIAKAADAAPEPEPAPPKVEIEPEPVAAEPVPAAEPVKAEVPEPPKADDRDRHVPLKALQEERQKRAEIERRLMELEQRLSQPQQPQQAEEEPDPETDPIGALKYQQRVNRELMAHQQQEAYRSQLQDAYAAAAQQFAAEVPDLGEAYQYAMRSRMAEYRALGYAEHQIPALLKQEELSIADSSFRRGINPAQTIYEFAKARGYTGPKPKEAATPPAAPPSPPAANVDLLKAKAEAATSISGGGKPPKSDLTPADLTGLHGAAFDSAWNKLFGGNKSGMFRV